MPGGKGNIRPKDGVPFKEGNKAAEKWSEEAALELGRDLLAWLLAADENVFFEDYLFISCDATKYPGEIYKDLPAYLAKKFSSFFDILEKSKLIEKIKLKKFGAFDKLNPSIVKFLLSAEYGMTTKTDITTQGDKINEKTLIMTPEEIKALNSKLEEDF